MSFNLLCIDTFIVLFRQFIISRNPLFLTIKMSSTYLMIFIVASSEKEVTAFKLSFQNEDYPVQWQIT